MTLTMLSDLLKSLSLLGVALLLGTFLRAKLRFLQATFMPASVIGGFILLIVGPQVLGLTGHLGIPDAWFSYYSMLPGVLIVPIVAGVPLGLRVQGTQHGVPQGFIRNVFPLFFISLGRPCSSLPRASRCICCPEMPMSSMTTSASSWAWDSSAVTAPRARWATRSVI